MSNAVTVPADKLAELQREAARYRWLRDKSEPNICAFYLSVGMGLHGVRFMPETVDLAIDAAMEREQPARTDGVAPSHAPSTDAMRDLLTRFTQATSIGHFHALLCEAKELLAAGVGGTDAS